MRLRSYLTLLVMAAVLPVVIFTGAMIFLSYHQQQENLAHGMIERTRAISAALDREFLVSIQSLKVLGASTDLARGDLAKFYGEMKGALAGYSRAWQNLTLTDSSGQQLINLRRPFGSPLPPSGNPVAVERVRLTKEAVIANLSPGPVTGALGIVVHVPVVKDDQAKYVLNAIFYPRPLTDLLLQQKLPPGWAATIIDANQVIAASTSNADKLFGKPAPSEFAAQVKQYQEAVWRGTSAGGSAFVAAHHRSALTGWTVGLTSPTEELDAPLRNSLMVTGVGGIVLLLIALALAALVGRRIAEPVSALSRAAEKVGLGEPSPAASSSIVEINRAARALEDAGKRRHEVEMALRRAREDLEEKVRERTRELVEANVRLREVDRFKSEFLANMSHELRTPLNAIIGFSELMHDGKAGGPVSAEHKEYLGDILNSGKHLLQLVNDVLDLSKVEAGRMEVLKRTFPIDGIIVEVVQNIAPAMSVKGLQLVRDIQSGLAPITTDRRKLLQILLNLTSNAVKFTDRGCITIGARIIEGMGQRAEGKEAEDGGSRIEDGRDVTPDTTLGQSAESRVQRVAPEFRTPKSEIRNLDGEIRDTRYEVRGTRYEIRDTKNEFRPARYLEFTVKDTGSGIKPEDLALLFQPFTQLDGSVRKRHEGTGLGLHLSKKLTEVLGGDLSVESEYGKGSTFTVAIPLEQ